MPEQSSEEKREGPALGAPSNGGANGHDTAPVNFDLTRQEVHQGVRAGDRYVRIVRPYGHLFQHVGPGYLRATEEVSEPKTLLSRIAIGFKHLLIGEPLPTQADILERLSKFKALPIFASDAISSVAYATEEILFVLALAGSGALALSVPISLAIALLLCIVALSERLVVFAYPNGGGSYIVSKENIGVPAGLIAAAALMLDYTLTVSVSVASGTAALISAFDFLLPYRVPIALMFVAIMVVGNLRGIRESGNIFALPTYVFVISLTALIVTGAIRWFMGLPPAEPVQGGIIEETEVIGLWLALSAFSAGSVAMSGTEAIANGVPAFKPPESKNAATTLLVMAGILAFFFMGIGLLAHSLGIGPSATETTLSQLARGIFGRSFFYYLIQFATMAILVLAANTSFNGFPRLASILAQDGFLPRRFALRGDRLAFSYGILVLGGVACLLLIMFEGDTHLLIPLYAVGVFLAFTMSQTGLIRHWIRLKPAGWRRGIAMNAAGALMCGVVLVIAAVTKFSRGAWIIIVLIPLLVVLFLRISAHYTRVSAALQMKVNGNGHKLGEIRQITIVPLRDLNLASSRALEFAHSISRQVTILHVAESMEEAEQIRLKLQRFDSESKLVVLESPFRALLDPLLAYIQALHEQDPEAFVTIIVPEIVTNHWWERLLHNDTADQLNRALRSHPNVAVVNVPFALHR